MQTSNSAFSHRECFVFLDPRGIKTAFEKKGFIVGSQEIATWICLRLKYYFESTG